MSFFATENFDASKVEKANFSPVPEGKYLCIVEKAEEGPTKKGDGTNLRITFQIIEGEHKGRKLFWTNLLRSKTHDVSVSRTYLASFCDAIGVNRPRSSAEFTGKKLIVDVKLEPDQKGELGNKVKGFDKRADAAAELAPPATQQQTGSDDAPWG